MMITKPVVILINGLFMYQPGSVSPLAPLANRLEAAGWSVCIDTHLLTRCPGIEPDLIVGHSQGGASALQLATRHPAATVVTFDAVRMPPCRAKRCLNFRTTGYPNVQSAENVPVFAGHATMVYRGDLQAKVLAMADEISSASFKTVERPERRVRRSERHYTKRRRAPELAPVVAWTPPVAPLAPVPDFPIVIRTVTAPANWDYSCNFSCRWEEAEILYTMHEPEWSMETMCAMMLKPDEAVCPQ